MGNRTTPLRFPPGVYKHRSIEEAEALREKWERANVDTIRKRKRAAKKKTEG